MPSVAQPATDGLPPRTREGVAAAYDKQLGLLNKEAI